MPESACAVCGERRPIRFHLDTPSSHGAFCVAEIIIPEKEREGERGREREREGEGLLARRGNTQHTARSRGFLPPLIEI